MNRRDVVRLGVSVGAIIVTDCLGDRGDVGTVDEIATTNSSNQSTSDGGETIPNTDTADEVDFETAESGPVKQISIVDTDTIESSEATGMHRIIIENTGEKSREVTIQIEHNGDIVLTGTDELAGDTALEFAVDKIGTYTTTIESRSARNISKTTVSNTNCDSRTIISFSNDGIASRNINRC